MDAIKKQASKLREQVAKQQQAVLRQFSGRFAIDASLLDEPDAESHQQLQMLSKSTKAAKHFQREILRGLEALIAASSRQMETASKLADVCFRFGENEHSDALLAKTSLHFGRSHRSMEDEREKLHKILGAQVYDPLRTMIMAAPLEDARHLANSHEKLRQDVEAQAIDVARRQMRSKEAGDDPDGLSKLQHSESRLSELRSALTALGREATSAMKSVAADQQRITFQQLLSMVDAERNYHHSVAAILDELHDEMIMGREKTVDLHENHSNGVEEQEADEDKRAGYFIAEVIHSFDADGDSELSLSVGDFVVVREAPENGWWEGECKGKAGWFPAAYVEHRDKAPADRVMEACSSTVFPSVSSPSSTSSSCWNNHL